MSPEPKAIRAFVAISIPTEVLNQLAAAQGEIKALLPHHGAAWTRPGNMHLTLRFLGNVPSLQIAKVEAQLREALTGFSELELVCAGLGCFPELRRPRVIWAGVQDAASRLPQLHLRVDATVREFAEKPAETKFVGHITLAHPRPIPRTHTEQLDRFLNSAADRQFGRWPAREVILWQSELTPAGANYHELARIPLG